MPVVMTTLRGSSYSSLARSSGEACCSAWPLRAMATSTTFPSAWSSGDAYCCQQLFSVVFACFSLAHAPSNASVQLVIGSTRRGLL